MDQKKSDDIKRRHKVIKTLNKSAGWTLNLTLVGCTRKSTSTTAIVASHVANVIRSDSQHRCCWQNVEGKVPVAIVGTGVHQSIDADHIWHDSPTDCHIHSHSTFLETWWVPVPHFSRASLIPAKHAARDFQTCNPLSPAKHIREEPSCQRQVASSPHKTKALGFQSDALSNDLIAWVVDACYWLQLSFQNVNVTRLHTVQILSRTNRSNWVHISLDSIIHTHIHHAITPKIENVCLPKGREWEREREKVVFWPHVSLVTSSLPQWPPTTHNTATHLTWTQSTVVVDYVRQHFHGRHQHQQLNCYLRGCKGESKWPEGDNQKLDHQGASMKPSGQVMSMAYSTAVTAFHKIFQSHIFWVMPIKSVRVLSVGFPACQ